MNNYINKKSSYEDSPETKEGWKHLSDEERVNQVFSVIKKNKKYENFEVLKAEKNGYIILKIEQSIQASERGIILLDLEELLKNTIDQGLTIWLEPVGDKSILRNLRGIEIKS
jgi:hypothetical protein